MLVVLLAEVCTVVDAEDIERQCLAKACDVDDWAISHRCFSTRASGITIVSDDYVKGSCLPCGAPSCPSHPQCYMHAWIPQTQDGTTGRGGMFEIGHGILCPIMQAAVNPGTLLTHYSAGRDSLLQVIEHSTARH